MKIAWTIIIAFILTANLSLASDNETTATFNVEKMTCATCPIAVRKAMQRVDGVKEVNVDLESNTAVVTFDASVATTSDIANASTEVGFPASVLAEK
jgi:mercuric ion binding protein